MKIQTLKITEEERVIISNFIKEDYKSNFIDFNILMFLVEKIEKLPINWKISDFKKQKWDKQKPFKKCHWYEVRMQANSCDVYESLAMVDINEVSLPHNGPYFKWENTSKIYAVWTCIKEFINWYNN